MKSRGTSSRHYLLHALRVAILIAILVLIRWQHAKSMSHAASSFAPPMARIAAFFPDAVGVEPRSDDGLTVLDAEQRPLGYVLQTSPGSDHVIGFSGPTNVLLALDLKDSVVGFDALSSGDTRDHLKQVLGSPLFMGSLHGMSRQEVANMSQVDAVAGATLTSLAIRESIMHRLGGQPISLRFPEPPSLATVKQLFPTAATVKQGDGSSIWMVEDAARTQLGTCLRTTPSSDNVVGYQGPTEALIGFSSDSRVIGIAVGESFDNEPYVGYVRDDAYFKSLFNEQTIEDLAKLDVESGQVEGVSGATMTSMAVTEGLFVAAHDQLQRQQHALQQQQGRASNSLPLTTYDWLTCLVILAALVIGLTRLRANRTLRVCFQILLVGYVGLTAGHLVSQAMLVGWAKHGLPVRSAFGLVALSLAAFSVPVFTRRNLYCTHLCPHGALQQLVRNRVVRKSVSLHRRVKLWLAMLPGLLLAWCVIVAMSSLGFSLVDIEPFDAYLFRIAGWATIVVAVVGLLASLFVPMAYCRYGCPTGALLQFLRFNAASDRWSVRDWVAVGYLAIAVLMFLMT